jgi:hypothetical protein
VAIPARIIRLPLSLYSSRSSPKQQYATALARSQREKRAMVRRTPDVAPSTATGSPRFGRDARSFEEFKAVIASLDRDGIPHALCGALAMAVILRHHDRAVLSGREEDAGVLGVSQTEIATVAL